MTKIVLILNNIRSCHNVGSLLRTADGLGIEKVFLCGYTPHPAFKGDTRLPHLVKKLTKQISKTALGAEEKIAWEYTENINEVLTKLEEQGYSLACLEQTKQAAPLNLYRPTNKVALILGNELLGIDSDLLIRIKNHLFIPMFGSKESFNVVQAAAMALYHLRFTAE